MSDPADTKTPDPRPDEDAPTGEKDLIVFYDAEGKVTHTLPAEDVVFIVPERLLRPERSPRTMAQPLGGEPETEEEE
jgi:hypothetical protein